MEHTEACVEAQKRERAAIDAWMLFSSASSFAASGAVAPLLASREKLKRR